MAKDEIDELNTLRLTAEIVGAYVSCNSLKPDQIPGLLQEVHDAVRTIFAGGAAVSGSRTPAVPVSKSISADYITCLEDGKKLKMLKRYLRTHYGLTPEEYRRKWKLPSDYPMVAPAYSKRRSAFAKQIGLGKVKIAAHKKQGAAQRRVRAGRKAA